MYEEVEKSSEPELEIVWIWGLSEREFKITVTGKVDSFQEQMGNRSRVMETLRTKRKH